MKIGTLFIICYFILFVMIMTIIYPLSLPALGYVQSVQSSLYLVHRLPMGSVIYDMIFCIRESFNSSI